MAEDDLQASISLDLDKNSFRKAKADLLRQAADFEKAGAGTSKQFLTQNKELIKQLQLQKQNIDAQEKSSKAAKERVNEEKRLLDVLDEQSSKARRDVGTVGDVDTGLSAVRGGLGTFTGGDSQALAQVAAVFEVTEALRQLQVAGPAAAESIKSIVNEIGVGKVGAVGAIAGLAIVISQLQSSTKAKADELGAYLEGQGNYFDLVQTGTVESIQAEKDKQQFSLDAARQERDTRKKQLADTVNALIDTQGSFRAGIAVFNASIGTGSPEIVALNKAIEDANKSVSDLEGGMNAFDQALDNTAVKARSAALALIGDADKEAERRAFINQTTKQSVDENIKLNESLMERNDNIAFEIIQLKQSGDTSDVVMQKIADLTDAYGANAEQMDVLRLISIPFTRQMQDEADAKKALEEQAKKAADLDKQKQATLQKLNDLQGKANETLAEFNDQLAKTKLNRSLRDSDELVDFQRKQAQDDTKHLSDLAKIEQDGKDKIAEIRASSEKDQQAYMEEELANVVNYRDELRKLNQEANKQLLRDVEDHEKTLRGAARDNNVLAFLDEVDKFKTEQARKQEDKNASVQELEQQFQVERDLRRKEFQAKQVDIQAEIALARQQTEQKLAETRNSFAQERQLEESERQLKLERQRRNDAIEDQQAREALQKRLNAINTEAQAQVNAINKIAQATQNLVAVANRIAQTTGNASSSSSGYKGGSQIGSKSYEKPLTSPNQKVYGSQIKVTAFANEGVVQKPTFAMLGDGLKSGEAEGVVKFKMSEGLPNAVMRRSGGGQPNYNYSININNPTIGDIANMSDVYDIAQTIITEIETSVANGLQTAIYNPQVGA